MLLRDSCENGWQIALLPKYVRAWVLASSADVPKERWLGLPWAIRGVTTPGSGIQWKGAKNGSVTFVVGSLGHIFRWFYNEL